MGKYTKKYVEISSRTGDRTSVSVEFYILIKFSTFSNSTFFFAGTNFRIEKKVILKKKLSEIAVTWKRFILSSDF